MAFILPYSLFLMKHKALTNTRPCYEYFCCTNALFWNGAHWESVAREKFIYILINYLQVTLFYQEYSFNKQALFLIGIYMYISGLMGTTFQQMIW